MAFKHANSAAGNLDRARICHGCVAPIRLRPAVTCIHNFSAMSGEEGMASASWLDLDFHLACTATSDCKAVCLSLKASSVE